MEENSVFENFELQLNQSAKDFLKEIAKWAHFISIMGFVAIGFLIIAIFSSMGLNMGVMASSITPFRAIIYFAMTVLYFFPVYYLFKFASNAKTALRKNDSKALTNSFEYLKSHYKYLGIFTITTLTIFILVFVKLF